MWNLGTPGAVCRDVKSRYMVSTLDAFGEEGRGEVVPAQMVENVKHFWSISLIKKKIMVKSYGSGTVLNHE